VNNRWSARLERLAPALFWGSVWGLWEATAGHAVHLLRVPGLAGAVMLPAAVVFMSRAFAATGREETIFLTGCVAAALKLLDLLVPGRNLLAVVNPAQFILLEALAVTGVRAALGAAGVVRRSGPLAESERQGSSLRGGSRPPGEARGPGRRGRKKSHPQGNL
jgi:hypothetical protein